MNRIKISLFVYLVFILAPLFSVFFVGFSDINLQKTLVLSLNSFSLAISATLLSFVFALPSAYLFTCKKNQTKIFLSILMFLMAILPPFLLGIIFSNLFYTLHVKSGFITLCITHMLVIYPYSFVLSSLGFSFVPKQAQKSAQLYVKNIFKRFYMFYFPFMKSSLLIAFILGVSISLSQYIITLMLGSARFSTLMLHIIPYLKSADIKSASSYGIVFLLNSFVAIYFIYILFRSKNVISKS